MPRIGRSASPNRIAVDLAPGLDVLVAVHHGVLGVVHHRPDDVGNEEQPAHRGHCVHHRGERHRDRPAERRAEHHLRQMRVALGERIDRRQAGTRERQPDGELVGEQHQHEGKHQQAGEYDQGLARRHASCRDGSPGSAFHLWIEFAVGEIVDGTTGRAHGEHAQRKDRQQLHRREVGGCQPQRPPRRPQQEQGANGAIHAGQHEVVAGLAAIRRGQPFEQPVEHARGAGGTIRRLRAARRLGAGTRTRSTGGRQVAPLALAGSRSHPSSVAWPTAVGRVTQARFARRTLSQHGHKAA